MNGRGKRYTTKHGLNDLPSVLRRSVESAADSGRLLTLGASNHGPAGSMPLAFTATAAGDVRHLISALEASFSGAAVARSAV